ncbi:MAG: lysophospholipid acyltransferase family protein [Mycobacterium sp.]|uniref:lysophospholipid acyltransferase family protein n=1 Tax=Mycobacterium sp. TaxID=1785 RepID=UPI003F9AFA7B
MAEPFYRFGELVVPSLVAMNGTNFTFHGLENIPERGGALIAQNHTSYLYWLPPLFAARERGRRMYFMIKSEMADVKAVNYVIKHARLIPVDRRHGHDAFEVAVQRLRDGELIGIHPEATISRSFELREFKTGAARMALDAQVPIVPLIVWGAQRIWPKDHPKKVFRNKVPVTVAAGRPLPPRGSAEELNVALREAMNALLYRVQEENPHPEGEYWVPRRLGGTAPNRDDSQRLRTAELLKRLRQEEERRR